MSRHASVGSSRDPVSTDVLQDKIHKLEYKLERSKREKADLERDYVELEEPSSQMSTSVYIDSLFTRGSFNTPQQREKADEPSNFRGRKEYRVDRLSSSRTLWTGTADLNFHELSIKDERGDHDGKAKSPSPKLLPVKFSYSSPSDPSLTAPLGPPSSAQLCESDLPKTEQQPAMFDQKPPSAQRKTSYFGLPPPAPERDIGSSNLPGPRRSQLLDTGEGSSRPDALSLERCTDMIRPSVSEQETPAVGNTEQTTVALWKGSRTVEEEPVSTGSMTRAEKCRWEDDAEKEI
ncbi:MAG: hypothetical protein Q9218_004794 [Villophora microphyllina]